MGPCGVYLCVIGEEVFVLFDAHFKGYIMWCLYQRQQLCSKTTRGPSLPTEAGT